MRVNIYAEEMTDRIEIIEKVVDGNKFTALRFYLELPATVAGKNYQGPFIHRPGDDDSSAVTFWGKRDLRNLLKHAINLLDEHYGEVPSAPAATGERKTDEELAKIGFEAAKKTSTDVSSGEFFLAYVHAVAAAVRSERPVAREQVVEWLKKHRSNSLVYVTDKFIESLTSELSQPDRKEGEG